MAKAELTGADKERARANLAYWEKREKAQAAAYQLEEDELARRVQARYNYLLTEIDARINDFYQRFAKAEGITMNLAEMAVSKMDVQAYNARAAQLVKDRDFSPKANQELRLYNATMRINRLEMLKSRIGLELVDTYQQLEDEFGEAFRTRCTEEYERQAGILGQSTNVMPQKDIERILTADFNNANWSSRLWANQGALRDRISELLTNGIIQGRSVRVMAKDLQELLIDPSASNALRLLRTEMNRVQTETQMASFRDNGYRQYMFISTEDSRTCSQCAHLNGEIFDVDDPEALKPPQHPNCRCSTAAYMDREVLERELNNTDNSSYEGIPRAWKKLKSDESNLDVINPSYKKFLRLNCSEEEAAYNRNCVNCVVAYDLRKKGWDVEARSFLECNLSKKADQAWENVEVLSLKTRGLSEFKSIVKEWGNGSRAFVGIEGPDFGHALVAEVNNETIILVDPQRNMIYTDSDSINALLMKCKEFWRIDNLEVSQTGINACKGR